MSDSRNIRQEVLRFTTKVRELKIGLTSAWECGHLYRTCIERRVPVHEPLVLISQIQRSGGTLISRLFDGHPQCHAHPWELHIGHPNKVTWPVLNLSDSAGTWFDTLYEWPVSRSFRKGYNKGMLYNKGGDEQVEAFPFLFPPSLQKAIFKECVAATEIKTQRDILDCYMTSYFNAWLDNHNLYGRSHKWITGFAAALNMKEGSIEKFFEAYPDGRFITIVRDPRAWYASARKHKEDYADLEHGIRSWKISTQAGVGAKQRYGDRVYIMKFEDLLSDTEGAMRALADYLDIDFLPILVEPTFNNFPIKANSRFSLNTYGITKEPLSRYTELLSKDEISYIDREVGELYEEADRLKNSPAASEALSVPA